MVKITSKMVHIYQTAWCHISEDNNLDIHCHEKLKSQRTLSTGKGDKAEQYVLYLALSLIMLRK